MSNIMKCILDASKITSKNVLVSNKLKSLQKGSPQSRSYIELNKLSNYIIDKNKLYLKKSIKKTNIEILPFELIEIFSYRYSGISVIISFIYNGIKYNVQVNKEDLRNSFLLKSEIRDKKIEDLGIK